MSEPEDENEGEGEYEDEETPEEIAWKEEQVAALKRGRVLLPDGLISKEGAGEVTVEEARTLAAYLKYWTERMAVDEDGVVYSH